MHKLQSPTNEGNRISASPMHQFATSGKTIISHLSFTQKEDGGICPRWHGQPALRIHLYAPIAGQKDLGGVPTETVGRAD